MIIVIETKRLDDGTWLNIPKMKPEPLIVILVLDLDTNEVLEIDDMYWFDEVGFQNNDKHSNGFLNSYKIIGMKEKECAR